LETRSGGSNWCRYRSGNTWDYDGIKLDKCTCPDKKGSGIVWVEACRPEPPDINLYMEYKMDVDEPLPPCCKYFAPGKAPPRDRGNSLVMV